MNVPGSSGFASQVPMNPSSVHETPGTLAFRSAQLLTLAVAAGDAATSLLHTASIAYLQVHVALVVHSTAMSITLHVRPL